MPDYVTGMLISGGKALTFTGSLNYLSPTPDKLIAQPQVLLPNKGR